MSKEEDKVLHSKRIQQKENHVKRQCKLSKQYGLPVKPGEEHRLQEVHALNCGNPNCVMCGNPRKFWKEKTIQEKSFEQTKNWIE